MAFLTTSWVNAEVNYPNILARGRITNVLPDGVYVSRVPLPNFPKPINLNCFLKSTRLTFSHSISYLVAIDSTI